MDRAVRRIHKQEGVELCNRVDIAASVLLFHFNTVYDTLIVHVTEFSVIVGLLTALLMRLITELTAGTLYHSQGKP